MEIKGKLKKFEVAARLETDAYGASCPSASIELTPQELADQLTLPEIETVRAFRCMMEVGDVPQPEKEEKLCKCVPPIYPHHKNKPPFNSICLDCLLPFGHTNFTPEELADQLKPDLSKIKLRTGDYILVKLRVFEGQQAIVADWTRDYCITLRDIIAHFPQPEKEEKWCGCKEPIYCLGCVEPICYKCRNPIKPPEKKIEPIDQIDYGYSKKATIEDCVIWIMQDREKLKELIKIINERI